MRHLIILLTIWSVAGVAPGRAQDAELPVRKVILYKHGVGFFERSAVMSGGETVRLQFKAAEMDDVLKSLTVDSRAGAVAGVRYDSNEPLTKKLDNFPFGVGKAQPLSRILDQFKGSRVRLRMASDEVEGTIVSAWTIAATAEGPESHRLLILDDDEMRTIDPAAALGLRFVDPKLQEQFREYLVLIAGSRNREKRNRRRSKRWAVRGGRLFSARYVVPTPVWKSSYRLVFDASKTGRCSKAGRLLTTRRARIGRT